MDVGFASVTINGLSLYTGMTHGMRVDALSNSTNDDDLLHHQHEAGVSSLTTDHSSHPSLFVNRTSHRSLIVHAGLYELRLDNQDGYVDFVSVQVACWECMVGEGGLRPEGLLGRTWERERQFSAREDDAELARYREQHDDVFGCSYHYDRFCSSRGSHGNSGNSSAAREAR